jgi:putative Mn2+ efflux pump MntP
MNPLSMTLLALAMSADAFAVSIVKGVQMQRPSWMQALRTGAVFGTVEAISPLLGWLLGAAAALHIQRWDHWIAFVLLLALGGHALYLAWRGEASAPAAASSAVPARPTVHSIGLLALAGLSTSIDALAVGASLALIKEPIVPMALAIGAATFALVTLGVMLGRMLGLRVGRWAGLFSGLVLIGIGCALLFEHLQ